VKSGAMMVYTPEFFRLKGGGYMAISREVLEARNIDFFKNPKPEMLNVRVTAAESDAMVSRLMNAISKKESTSEQVGTLPTRPFSAKLGSNGLA
jgi:hypothetical protein